MVKLVTHRVDMDNLAYASALGEELHHAGSLRDIPFDREYNRAVIHARMRDPSYYLMLARDINDTSYEGIMVGFIDTFVFSPARWAHEVLLYVRPGVKYRGAIALNLVRGFVEWATDNKCVRIHTGDIAAINAMAVDQLYRIAGFERAGSIYEYMGAKR